MKIEDYFEEQGSGSPIVFIHGSYATSSTWKKMINQLSEHHRCISIKLPGHGGAPEANDFDAPTVETELDILRQVVESLTDKLIHDEPIHIVGHSFGGVVALAQALKGNLNLSQVTLFEPVSTWVLDRVGDQEMSDRVQLFLDKYTQDIANKKQYAYGQVIDFWGEEGAFDSLPDFIKDGMEPLLKNNIRHWDLCTSIDSDLNDLKNCTVPTRLVFGDKSNPVARAICEHLKAHIPNSKTYKIEGASHFLVTSHAEECLQALNDPFEI